MTSSVSAVGVSSRLKPRQIEFAGGIPAKFDRDAPRGQSRVFKRFPVSLPSRILRSRFATLSFEARVSPGTDADFREPSWEAGRDQFPSLLSRQTADPNPTSHATFILPLALHGKARTEQSIDDRANFASSPPERR